MMLATRARIDHLPVRGGEERGQLAVFHPSVVVDVGDAAQAGDHLVREHAGLIDVPFMRGRRAAGGDHQPHVRVADRAGPRQMLEELLRANLDGLRFDVARTHDRFGVARVHEQVDHGRADLVEHALVHRRLRKRPVDQREGRVAVAVARAVPAVEEHERGLRPLARGGVHARVQRVDAARDRIHGRRAHAVGDRGVPTPGSASGIVSRTASAPSSFCS